MKVYRIYHADAVFYAFRHPEWQKFNMTSITFIDAIRDTRVTLDGNYCIQEFEDDDEELQYATKLLAKIKQLKATGADKEYAKQPTA